MGLDMYLDARKHLSKYGREGEEGLALKLRKQFGIPESGNLESVDLSFEVAYWRKANQIHNWFITNCADGNDDCRAVYVSREDLEKLLGVVNTVLKSTKLKSGKIKNGQTLKNGQWETNIQDGKIIEDATVAQELLPAQEGFFFGSTSYDEWYFRDLEHTKEVLTKILENPNLKDFDFEYRASW